MDIPPRVDQSLFEAIFQYATMGILVTNQDGKIIMVNKFAAQEFGYQERELIGKTVEQLIPNRFHKQHHKERQAYYQHARTRAMGAGRDLYGLRKDGSEFPVEVSLSPFHTDQGIFVIAFIIDITIRKEKESAEIHYQEKINQILGSLTKEKELNDMKSRFVSMASHEFRTPLSTILSSASLIGKYALTEEQAKRKKHVERIQSAVRNLNAILNEFLAIGKIENGKIAVRYSRFDLQEMIAAICNEMQDIRKPGQEIRYLHTGKSLVMLDIDLLRNILNNLLSNAIKFSEEGGVIEVDSVFEDEQVVIKIKDNGLGISAQDQKHLFERFFRGNNVLNIQGTGLGLHIVGRYVELMEGTISFKSELGKGTEFILIFKQ